MRFTVHKIFFLWDYDREEQWLNDMAAKGNHLVSAHFFRFVFEKGIPGEYEYHLEWMKYLPNHPESIKYRSFLEETGFEEVATFKKWLFVRRKTAEMSFSLFSNIDSRLEHLRRIMIFIPILFFSLLAIMLSELYMLNVSSVSFQTVIIVTAIFLVMLALTISGFFKSLNAYRKLKKERLIRE